MHKRAEPLREPRPPAATRPAPVPADATDLKPAPLGRASDEDLMRRTQEGDQQAYSMLYERYSASVLSYLYRMLGNVEDVESIGQEVFLRAFRFAATYRYPQKFSTWLFTITRNLAINHARRRKRSPVRNVTELTVRRTGQYITVEIEANAFLLHMVRNIVGTLLEIGEGRKPVQWTDELLALRDRTKAAPTAPPNGLSLIRVRYPAELGFPEPDAGVMLP